MKRLNKKISVVVYLTLLFLVLNLIFNLSKGYYYVVQGTSATIVVTFVILMIEYRTLKNQ